MNTGPEIYSATPIAVLLIITAAAIVCLVAVTRALVSSFSTRRGDCAYARTIFHEYITYRTVAGPCLSPHELDAVNHALVDSREVKFVFEILEALPRIGDETSISFISRCASGESVMAHTANVPEVRSAAVACLERLTARLAREKTGGSLLRPASSSHLSDDLLRPASGKDMVDVDRLLRPQDHGLKQ